MLTLTGGNYGGFIFDNGSITLYDENNEVIDSILDFTFNNNILTIKSSKYVVENNQVVFQGME